MVGAVLEMHSTWSSAAAISENMFKYREHVQIQACINNGAYMGPIKTPT